MGLKFGRSLYWWILNFNWLEWMKKKRIWENLTLQMGRGEITFRSTRLTFYSFMTEKIRSWLIIQFLTWTLKTLFAFFTTTSTYSTEFLLRWAAVLWSAIGSLFLPDPPIVFGSSLCLGLGLWGRKRQQQQWRWRMSSHHCCCCQYWCHHLDCLCAHPVSKIKYEQWRVDIATICKV